MKKRYDKLSMSPLGFVPERRLLLETSIVESNPMVTTTAQEVQPYDFSNDTSFQQDWE